MIEEVLFYDENVETVKFKIDAKFPIDYTDYVAIMPIDEKVIYILKIVFDELKMNFFKGLKIMN